MNGLAWGWQIKVKDGWADGGSNICRITGGFASSEFKNCSDIHQLNIHRHVDGEKHSNGVGLSEDQRILSGETWPWISGT